MAYLYYTKDRRQLIVTEKLPNLRNSRFRYIATGDEIDIIIMLRALTSSTYRGIVTHNIYNQYYIARNDYRQTDEENFGYYFVPELLKFSNSPRIKFAPLESFGHTVVSSYMRREEDQERIRRDKEADKIINILCAE
jgi:hypothetical protein